MQDNFYTGAATEAFVASYFLENRYAVYWPALTQSRCDFVIEKDGTFQKVQIKKATWSKTGKYRYLQCRLMNRNVHSKWYEKGDYDLIVFVDDDKRMWIARFEEVNHLVSVALDGSKEGYVPQTMGYDPREWRVR